MIISEELSASLDEPAECVVVHRVEPTRLQTLALQLTEKLNGLAENNEQIMDPRSGKNGWNYFSFIWSSRIRLQHKAINIDRTIKTGHNNVNKAEVRENIGKEADGKIVKRLIKPCWYVL